MVGTGCAGRGAPLSHNLQGDTSLYVRHGEPKAQSSFCPLPKIPTSPAQNSRGASQQTGIAPPAEEVGGHPSLPGPRGCWEQLTVAGDSCPVPAGDKPRTRRRRRLSGAPSPAPTAPPCVATASSSSSAPCQVRPARLRGHLTTPLPLHLGVCYPWEYRARHRPTGLSLCWQPLPPCPALERSPGELGEGVVGIHPCLHAGHWRDCQDRGAERTHPPEHTPGNPFPMHTHPGASPLNM